jgi:MFS family permease
MVLFGFGNGGAVVANITLVQRAAPDRVRGRAFTLLMSVNYAFLGLSFALAGPLTNAYGARWAYLVAAVTVLGAAAVAIPFTRGIEVDLAPARPHGA